MVSELSKTARRILEHIYKEASPEQRMVGSICMALMLDTPDWQAASTELLDRRFIVAQSDWSYNITPEGMTHAEQSLGYKALEPSAEAESSTSPTDHTPQMGGSHPLVEFLIAYNHDLRSPLNSIIGFSRVIIKGIDGPINDMQREDLNSVYENGQRLLHMIGEMVDMAKLESGDITPLFKRLMLRSIFEEVIEHTQKQIAENPVTLHSSLTEPNLAVWSDEGRLLQILNNIMSFCARNLKMGSIFLQAGIEDGQPVITIEDTGSGWPPEEVNLLLRPYRQPAEIRHIGSAGLSLAIADGLARLLGGALKVSSQLGKGTTFTLTLPHQPPPGTTVIEDEMQ